MNDAKQLIDAATRTSEAVVADTAKSRSVATITAMEFNPVLNAELDRLMKEGKTHKEAAALIENNKPVLRKARAWARARYGTPAPTPAPESQPAQPADDDAQARDLYTTALALRETATAADILTLHPTYRAAIAALTAKPTASYEAWLASLCALQQPGGVT